MAGISIWQLAIIALIVLLLFGSKRLRTLGGDLGTTIKGFKQAIGDDASQDAHFNLGNDKQEPKAEQSKQQGREHV